MRSTAAAPARGRRPQHSVSPRSILQDADVQRSGCRAGHTPGPRPALCWQENAVFLAHDMGGTLPAPPDSPQNDLAPEMSPLEVMGQGRVSKGAHVGTPIPRRRFQCLDTVVACIERSIETPGPRLDARASACLRAFGSGAREAVRGRAQWFQGCAAGRQRLRHLPGPARAHAEGAARDRREPQGTRVSSRQPRGGRRHFLRCLARRPRRSSLSLGPGDRRLRTRLLR